MKTIVFLSDGRKHSAWNNAREAKNQIRVLQNNGYKGAYYDYIEHTYESGHYFI